MLSNTRIDVYVKSDARLEDGASKSFLCHQRATTTPTIHNWPFPQTLQEISQGANRVLPGSAFLKNAISWTLPMIVRQVEFPHSLVIRESIATKANIDEACHRRDELILFLLA